MAAWLSSTGARSWVCARYMHLLRDPFLEPSRGGSLHPLRPLHAFPGARRSRTCWRQAERDGGDDPLRGRGIARRRDQGGARARARRGQLRVAARPRQRSKPVVRVVRELSRLLIQSRQERTRVRALASGAGLELVASDGTAVYLEVHGLDVCASTADDGRTARRPLKGSTAIHAGLLAPGQARLARCKSTDRPLRPV